MTYIDPEDMSEEEAAAHEAARVELVKIMNSAKPAEERNRRALDKAHKAKKAERARAKKAQEKILDLEKAAGLLHDEVRVASEARQRLLAHYVPRKVMSARDGKFADATRLRRVYDEAVILRKRQEAHMKSRSEKMVHGALKDKHGRLQYHDQTEDDKKNGRPAKVKMGLIRNPAYWRAEEDKHQAQKVLDALELQEAEALSKLTQAEKLLEAAQAAMDAAVEAAFRE